MSAPSITPDPRIGEERFKGNQVTMVSRSVATIDDVRRGRAALASIPTACPDNLEILGGRLRALADGRVNFTDPVARANYSAALKASLSSDEARSDIAAYRQFELVHNIMATPFALTAFQQINLSADELPQIVFPRGRNAQRFQVRSESVNGGGSESEQWRTSRSAEQIEMQYLATDKVEYPLIDLQTGNVNEEQNILAELSYDMDMKVDQLALAQIDAAKTTSGLRALMSIHPLVDQTNIPDANYLDLTDVGLYGPNQRLTLPKLKAILNYLVLVGAADPTRAIRPTAFVMSPQHQMDVWDFVDMVAGYDNGDPLTNNPKNMVPEDIRTEIFKTGAFANCWGHTFQWQLNATVAKGKLYVFTDAPLGWLFTKSEFDRTIQWNEANSPRHSQYNYGEVMYSKAIRYYVPALWKHHILIVDF